MEREAALTTLLADVAVCADRAQRLGAETLAAELYAVVDLAMAHRATIEGDPQPQQRTRGGVAWKTAERFGHAVSVPYVRMRDPLGSRAWKGAAAWFLQRALRAPRNPLSGPLLVHVRAVNAAPQRSRAAAAEWNTKATGDADNVAKAVLDAGNKVTWHDDRQVARLVVERVVGAPGEVARVEVAFGPLSPLAARIAP